MLRHQKKHSGQHHASGQQQTNSASDLSDEEPPPPPLSQQLPAALALGLKNKIPGLNIPEILQKDFALWNINQIKELGVATNILNNASQFFTLFQNHHRKLPGATTSSEGHADDRSDLIGDLLGISDGLVTRALSSADEAAKVLGVEK